MFVASFLFYAQRFHHYHLGKEGRWMGSYHYQSTKGEWLAFCFLSDKTRVARKKALNALNADVMRELLEALSQFEKVARSLRVLCWLTLRVFWNRIQALEPQSSLETTRPSWPVLTLR